MVTVILGCTLIPIPLDFDGIIRFCTLLAVVEERLRNILDEYNLVVSNSVVPDFHTWIIYQLDMNRDALTDYKGETFTMSIPASGLKSIVNRIYTKDFGKKKRIRNRATAVSRGNS